MDAELGREVASAERGRLDAVDPRLYPLVRDPHSPDLKVAEKALFFLDERVCIQGVAVNRSTAVAVPVIIRMAAFGEDENRLRLLELLRRIQRGSHAWRKAASLAKPEHAGNYREKLEWELAVDSAMASIVPDLETLSRDPDVRIANISFELLGRIRE